MKFRSYLTERSDDPDNYFDQIWRVLQRDCKPFIDVIKKAGPNCDLVYRGEDNLVGTTFIKKKPGKKDRQPRYVSKFIHEDMGKLFQSKFGWNARTDGTFTGSFNIARNFGITRIFFPTGPLKYVLLNGEHNIDTLYQFYDEFSYDTDREPEYNQRLELIEKDIFPLYTDKGLDVSLKSEKFFECIFRCENYYLLDRTYITAIKHRIFHA